MLLAPVLMGCDSTTVESWCDERYTAFARCAGVLMCRNLYLDSSGRHVFVEAIGTVATSNEGVRVPKLVDHVERRRAIIAAAWRIIADRGIDGINMRDLATEAGYTNGALSHYFSGKDEILRTAFDFVIESTNERIERSIERRHGRKALRRMCFEIMPLTDEAKLEARIAVSLWQRAITDPQMVTVNDTAVAAWKVRLAELWRDAIAAGELPDRDVEVGVEALMTMMIGLQVTAALSPDGMTRKAQLAMLDSVLGG